MLEKNYTGENGLKTKQNELQELRKKKMEGMLIQSRARLIGEGENSIFVQFREETLHK